MDFGTERQQRYGSVISGVAFVPFLYCEIIAFITERHPSKCSSYVLTYVVFGIMYLIRYFTGL